MAVVVVVVFVGIFLLVERQPGTSAIQAGGNAKPNATATREVAPQNIVVPNQNSQNVPQGVAIPQTVSPASQVSSASNRDFSIKIEANAFTPDTIIVRKFDVINLTVNAVDGNYDLTQPDYGLNLSAPKGTSKTFQFQAYLEGKFTFYCASCGGPEKGPIGYLVVAPKQ